MVRHNCDTCDTERSAVIRDDEYVCASCGEPVDADRLLTPEDALSERDRAALGMDAVEETDDE